MKKIYIKINGITCDHCRQRITTSLKEISGIKRISFDGNIALIEYTKSLDLPKIVDTVNGLDYSTNLEMISDDKNALKKPVSLTEVLLFGAIFLFIWALLKTVFHFNLFNTIPTIDSEITYIMLFVTGLLTSIHCISMCGAINIFVSTSAKRDFKKPLSYNLGRLISYTLLGGIVGLIGSVVQLNTSVRAFIILVAALFMFLMALGMMGAISFHGIQMPRVFDKVKTRSSFIIGLLNGFMPCGPLQAMQLYALSTGSFVYGALSMFLFCLGTIPLMLGVGIALNFFNGKVRKLLSKISIVLILLLSLVMFNRGLLQIGVDVSKLFSTSGAEYDNHLKAEIKDGYQYIEFDLETSGYQDIIVQKGIPVKMNIKATFRTLTGCNDALIINAFGIQKDLKQGDNLIEFTPDKTGNFVYSCWMGMLKNEIVIVDDLEKYQK